jgi:hypothetical protein
MTATLTRPTTMVPATAVVDSPEWIWTEWIWTECAGDIVPRGDAGFVGDYDGGLAAAAVRMIAAILSTVWAERGYTEVVAVPASVFGSLDGAEDLAGLAMPAEKEYLAVWAEVMDEIDFMDVVEAADLVAEYRAAQ